jgi:hypothetical protein
VKKLLVVVISAVFFAGIFYFASSVWAGSAPGPATGLAWGNYLGWVQFGTASSSVIVTTTTLQGYAWSKNFGWINFGPFSSSSGVVNDGSGHLSGYAWAQNAGWINFAGVTIDNGGVFHGVASGTVAGSMVFDSSTYNCVDCNVTTTWTPPAILTVSGIYINSGSIIGLTAGTTTSVPVSFTITDLNGCSSLFTGGTTTVTLYIGGVGSSCAANNLNCYRTTNVTNNCSSGNLANATATLPLYYFAQSTGNPSSTFPSDHWYASVTAQDSTNATTTATSTPNDVNFSTAINITTSSINYGTVPANSNTGSLNQQTIVQNAGNTSTTLQLSGTISVGTGGTIATSSQHYAKSNFTYGGAESALSDALTTVSGFLLQSATTTSPVQGTIYWGFGVPPGTATGTYNATDTFTAAYSP